MSNNTPDMPECVEKAIENVLDEPTKAMGATFADIWFLVLGGKINYLAKKKRIKLEKDLNAYYQLIENERDKIPEDKRIEPDIQKVAALLDASKFCIDKEELRELFAKLIGATMNKDTEKYVHISFGQILSQLVPDEAKILMNLPKKSLFEPIVDIRGERPDVYGSFTLHTNLGVLGEESGCDDPEALPLYLDNLLRLGLVTIPAGEWLIDEWRYSKILASSKIQSIYETAQQSHDKVQYVYKMVGVTDLGEALRKMCI